MASCLDLSFLGSGSRVLRSLRVFRALRSLRSISVLAGLQVSQILHVHFACILKGDCFATYYISGGCDVMAHHYGENPSFRNS